jgi:gliding motility-associated-like protein
VLQSGPAAPIGAGYTVSNYFSDEQVITVNVEGYGTYEYSLDGGPWVESNIFTNVSAGGHTIQVRDITACSEFILDMGDIKIFGIPKYFSPNQDGYHETWMPYFADIYVEQVYIFDRYGKLITGFPGDNKGWDGTFNGERLPATDYWYVVELKEGGTLRGHFALIR